MVYVKINDVLYPASVSGRMSDMEWGGRESKAIKVEMDYESAKALFVDDLKWSIVDKQENPVYEVDEQGQYVLDGNGERIRTGVETQETEWDNSEFAIAGDITDHRNGTVTAKMGKPTDSELLAIIMGG